MLCHWKCSFRRSWKYNLKFSMSNRDFGISVKPLWMAIFSKKKEFSSSSASHYGGYSAVSKGSTMRTTAIIFESASGKKCPPFIIAARKMVMESWNELLAREEYAASASGRHWITNSDWLPDDSCIRCTEKGLMDINTMQFLMNRKTIPSGSMLLSKSQLFCC